MEKSAYEHAWHALGPAEVIAPLGADADRGLTGAEARRRLAQIGPNRIGEHPKTPLWRPALAQFRSLVVLLLFAAAAIAWGLGERAEASAILVALLVHGCQELLSRRAVISDPRLLPRSLLA